MNKQPNKGQIIGANLVRLREKKGWSTKRLAKEAGVALYTVQQQEKGVTQKSKYLPDFARILGEPLSEIDPSQKTVERAPTVAELSTGLRDLPLHATTDGGEGVLVMSSDPIRHIVRPSSVEGIADAYAVIVRGESMGQVAPHGCIVVVDPHLPAQKGDVCVFRSQKHDEFTSTVKEFVSGAGDNWKVKRYYPEEKEYLLKKKDWSQCHVVVTIHRR